MSSTQALGRPLSELQALLRGGRIRINRGVEVDACMTYFPQYDGPRPAKALGKPVVGPPSQPFAELQVVQRLEAEGKQAAWVYRRDRFLRSWEPAKEARFPADALKLLERIQKRGGPKARCWAVVAWKSGEPHFAEIKRAGSTSTLRDPKLRWMKAALAEGVPQSAFEIVEWYGGSLKGRVLRLTSYLYDKKDPGWVEHRNGKIAYRGGGRSHREMVEHYRDWGARTEADLLWLVFVRNSSGFSWCNLKEYADRKRKRR